MNNTIAIAITAKNFRKAVESSSVSQQTDPITSFLIDQLRLLISNPRRLDTKTILWYEFAKKNVVLDSIEPISLDNFVKKRVLVS